jgi:ubiquinone/menaquinone biosynthesis C-methylase UbiE
MPAAYDTYDYPAYWTTRDYEHLSEVYAIKAFLTMIRKIDKIVDIGAGYGRLTPSYIFRAKRLILTDPSAKLLKIARINIKTKNTKFIQSTLDNLPKNIKAKSVDLAIMVRVLHHIEDPNKAITIINRLLKKNGYLIIEFANKEHLKAKITQMLKGNITFPLDIFPKDRRSPLSVKKQVLPFFNFHPDIIKRYLEDNNFEIVEQRSVSNIRSPLAKRIFPLDFLLFFEKKLQKVLANMSFGPSIFILARKK